MKPVICNLGILLSLSVLFSCHKSNDDTPGETKLHISRVVQHQPSPSNKSMVIDFDYDNQQRLDKLIFAAGDESSGTLVVTPAQTFQYYYNGTAKNPYKSINNLDIISSGTVETYFSFNNAGQLTYDSIQYIGYPSYTYRDYMYAPEKILVKKSSYNPSSIPALSQLTDTFLIKDNNLTEVRFGNPSSAYTTTTCYKYTYDNKINPVNSINLGAWEPVNGISGLSTPGVSKNNLVEYTRGIINYKGEFMPAQTTTLTYTYNSSGLPETCIVKNDQETYTVNYYYGPK